MQILCVVKNCYMRITEKSFFGIHSVHRLRYFYKSLTNVEYEGESKQCFVSKCWCNYYTALAVCSQVSRCSSVLVDMFISKRCLKI
jgi:hypothetical protein